MMYCIAYELLRSPYILHDIGYAASLTELTGMVEKLDTQFGIWRVRVKVLHAMHRELLARGRGDDKVKMPPSHRNVQWQIKNIAPYKFAKPRYRGRFDQIDPQAIPATGSKCLAPAPPAAK